MRHFEPVAKTITMNNYIKTTCDKCSETIPEPKGYDTREFDLEFTTGYSHVNCGYQNGWSVDLCDECIAWLKQVLVENGVTLVPVEADW